MHASGAILLPEAPCAHPARPTKLLFYQPPSRVVSSVREDQTAQTSHDATGTEPASDVGDVIQRVLNTLRRCGSAAPALAADVQSRSLGP